MPKRGRGVQQQRILELLGDGVPRWQGQIAVEIGCHGYSSVKTTLMLLEADKLIEGKLEDPSRPSSKTNRKLWSLIAV